ncbi:MAG: hypothetical protein KDB88_08675 [Flavobacteriales bacterium]|nr:hypothetical protein [Flavobacteriales bacterium]
MALSQIYGQTPLGNTRPSNLQATIPTNESAPRGVPAGFGVSVEGMLRNSNPGMYGIVFGYSVPAGVKVVPQRSGSMIAPGSSNYDYMLVVTEADPAQKVPTTMYWEVWFSDDDVNGNDWNTEVQLQINGSNSQYSFSKKRTGDLLADEVSEKGYEKS